MSLLGAWSGESGSDLGQHLAEEVKGACPCRRSACCSRPVGVGELLGRREDPVVVLGGQHENEPHVVADVGALGVLVREALQARGQGGQGAVRGEDDGEAGEGQPNRGAFGRPTVQQIRGVVLDRAAGPGLAVGVGVSRDGRPGLGKTALGDGGSPEQQVDGLEPVPGGNPVVDGEDREQDEAVSGGGPAGVLVEDLVVEVAEEAPSSQEGSAPAPNSIPAWDGLLPGRRSAMTSRKSRRIGGPEAIASCRVCSGSACVSMAGAAYWSVSGRRPTPGRELAGRRPDVCSDQPALAGASARARVEARR
ncbi:hypothetical protein [Kitasatospora sp. NPDC056184]|uniref:hypothetical protein n=1 Tax=Kitasatospora sp. NPDC056184 TaxID=3345738 RepID=UPI0035D8022F